jgi:toxin ParE1/3/4
MQVIWSATAVAQLAEIRSFIEQDKPEAARGVAARIVAAADQLARSPHIGRQGRTPHTRELVIAGTPYILPYRIQGHRIRILAVFHASRQWPPASEA